MRFKQHINELTSFKKWDELSATLNKDCQPYIRYLKDVKYLLIRGVDKPPASYNKKNIRTNRKPRMIDKSLHDMLGKYSKERFGWSIRSEGLFTTVGRLDASKWGKPVVVFPIGKFKHVLNVNVEELYSNYDYWYGYDENDWNRILNSIDDYKTDEASLKKYLTYGSGFTSECIIKAKSYYVINYEWFDTLLAYYSQGKNTA